MDNPPPTEPPTTPTRRVVPRRLVQSTLFPLKSQPQLPESCDPKAERGNGENDDGDDEEFCGSQSKRGRKSKAKKTPPIKAPKKSGKRSANSTPKKNGVQLGSEDTPPIIFDLRLEAKLAAEETTRVFSGKQIHPFFSSCKAGKRKREATEVDGDLSFVGSKGKEIACGPIHVFERTQNGSVFLDWRNWTFCEETFMKSTPNLEYMSSSIFEGSVECLHFGQLPIAFEACNSSTFQNMASSDQCLTQKDCAYKTSPRIPDLNLLADEQVMHYQHSEEADLSKEPEDGGAGLSSKRTAYIKKSDIEQQNILDLEERVMSNYASSGNQPMNSLWTYKYRPMKSRDVCGNEESVNYLSEWLRGWYERGLRASGDPTGSGYFDRQDDDYSCSESDSEVESENEEASRMKNNVLLVTGPIGSGKSAAIYACAQEQGFKVLELSASECRNGALVKQKFGEALESRNLRRSVANPASSQNCRTVESLFVKANGMTNQEIDDEMVEVISISDEDSHDATESSVKSDSKEEKSKIKHLILFEDVDITFLEDRGFIAAIQHIAKTAKGPIILTSNSQNPVLPDNFDRLQVYFTLPSPKELQSHSHMVCAAESGNLQPCLLERLIECCRGDIRKSIMHLQFWCQGKSIRKDAKMRDSYGSMLFNVEAGHLMLPKILPWDLPSQLSELVEKEITKVVSMMEESSTSMEVVEEKIDNTEVQDSFDMPYNQMESLEAKKIAMLSRNGSVHGCGEYTAQIDTASEFSNDLDARFSLCRRNVRRMHDVVMSSDSEDEFVNHGYVTVEDKDTDNDVLGVNTLSQELFCFGAATTDQGRCPCSETAGAMHVSGTCNSLDISCVPESSFVPETEIDNGMELSSQTVSTNRVANGLKGVILGEELHVEGNNCDKLNLELQLNSHKWGSNCASIAECSHPGLEDSQKEHVDTVARAYQAMDECSRIDFNKGSKVIQGPESTVVTDLVQDSWDKLRGSCSDLKNYATSEQQDACQIVMLAYQMSNLISETDILFSNCQSVISDSLEPALIPLEESDAYSCYEERLLLASTTAQHGFCFYANRISSAKSKERCVRIDLASEMLANTASMMAVGELIGQGTRTSKTSSAGSKSEITLPNVTSETKSNVFDIVQSIVPPRTYSTLKGGAYHEYLSSMRHISRSEASRLSGVEKITRRRRRRVAPHYLTSGALMLSSEHISLLDQHNLFGKTSSSR